MEQHVCGQTSPEVGIKNCSGCLQIKHYFDPSFLEQRVQALTTPLVVSFLAVKLEIYEQKMMAQVFHQSSGLQNVVICLTH